MSDITTKLLLKTAAKAGKEDAIKGNKRRVYDSLRPIIQEAYDLSFDKHEGSMAYVLNNRDVNDISDLERAVFG